MCEWVVCVCVCVCTCVWSWCKMETILMASTDVLLSLSRTGIFLMLSVTKHTLCSCRHVMVESCSAAGLKKRFNLNEQCQSRTDSCSHSAYLFSVYVRVWSSFEAYVLYVCVCSGEICCFTANYQHAFQVMISACEQWLLFCFVVAFLVSVTWADMDHGHYIVSWNRHGHKHTNDLLCRKTVTGMADTEAHIMIYSVWKQSQRWWTQKQTSWSIVCENSHRDDGHRSRHHDL